jgi:hypothetical protein
MRRLLALPLVAAALALPAPAHASYEVCTPVNQVGVCAGYVCVDLCGPEPYVYSFCEHPVPQQWCDVVLFRAGGH